MSHWTEQTGRMLSEELPCLTESDIVYLRLHTSAPEPLRDDGSYPKTDGTRWTRVGDEENTVTFNVDPRGEE